METLLATCSHRGSEPQEGGGIARCLDRSSEDVFKYTNAVMKVFVPEGIAMAKGGRFVKIFGFFIDNTLVSFQKKH